MTSAEARERSQALFGLRVDDRIAVQIDTARGLESDLLPDPVREGNRPTVQPCFPGVLHPVRVQIVEHLDVRRRVPRVLHVAEDDVLDRFAPPDEHCLARVRGIDFGPAFLKDLLNRVAALPETGETHEPLLGQRVDHLIPVQIDRTGGLGREERVAAVGIAQFDDPPVQPFLAGVLRRIRIPVVVRLHQNRAGLRVGRVAKEEPVHRLARDDGDAVVSHCGCRLEPTGLTLFMHGVGAGRYCEQEQALFGGRINNPVAVQILCCGHSRRHLDALRSSGGDHPPIQALLAGVFHAVLVAVPEGLAADKRFVAPVGEQKELGRLPDGERNGMLRTRRGSHCPSWLRGLAHRVRARGHLEVEDAVLRFHVASPVAIEIVNTGLADTDQVTVRVIELDSPVREADFAGVPYLVPVPVPECLATDGHGVFPITEQQHLRVLPERERHGVRLFSRHALNPAVLGFFGDNVRPRWHLEVEGAVLGVGVDRAVLVDVIARRLRVADHVRRSSVQQVDSPSGQSGLVAVPATVQIHVVECHPADGHPVVGSAKHEPTRSASGVNRDGVRAAFGDRLHE